MTHNAISFLAIFTTNLQLIFHWISIIIYYINKKEVSYMKQYNYINLYTGEIYQNFKHAFFTVVSDMKHYKKCRTLKMLHIKRFHG